MWDAQIDTMDGGRVRQVRILSGDKMVSYAEIVERWRSDGAFRAFFIGILADAPYGAYLWETPTITRLTSTRAFEFVLVDSPALARLNPDPVAFASHFEATNSGHSSNKLLQDKLEKFGVVPGEEVSGYGKILDQVYDQLFAELHEATDKIFTCL
jgi:hypothetical protein